jgi:hypothetical protein
MSRTRKSIAVGMAGLTLLTSAGCFGGQAGEARRADTNAAGAQLRQYQQAQPVPKFTSSQLRQNLIEIETAQAHTTATTSFMFLLAGTGQTGPLVKSCPSIGFPIPATYQLTSPDQPAGNRGAVVAQLEANGVFTGDTTGTYVMCVGEDGKPFAFYHEGYVSTVSGPAHWDNAKGEIVMDGSSSAPFTKVGD